MIHYHLGSGRTTGVECTPCDQEVMGLDPAGRLAFFLFSSYLFFSLEVWNNLKQAHRIVAKLLVLMRHVELLE